MFKKKKYVSGQALGKLKSTKIDEATFNRAKEEIELLNAQDAKLLKLEKLFFQTLGADAQKIQAFEAVKGSVQQPIDSKLLTIHISIVLGVALALMRGVFFIRSIFPSAKPLFLVILTIIPILYTKHISTKIISSIWSNKISAKSRMKVREIFKYFYLYYSVVLLSALYLFYLY